MRRSGIIFGILLLCFVGFFGHECDAHRVSKANEKLAYSKRVMEGLELENPEDDDELSVKPGKTPVVSDGSSDGPVLKTAGPGLASRNGDEEPDLKTPARPSTGAAGPGTAVTRRKGFDLLAALLDVMDEDDEDCRQRIACQMGVIRPIGGAIKSINFAMTTIGKAPSLEQSRYYAPFVGPGKGREAHKKAYKLIKCEPSFDFQEAVQKWQKSSDAEIGFRNVALRMVLYLIKRFILIGRH